jgi:hypothetical protein
MARPVCDFPEPDSPAAHRVDDALGRTEAHVQIFDGQ